MMGSATKVVVCLLIGSLVMETMFQASEAFIFGSSGQLECQRSGRRPSCNNCRYICRCTGDGTSAFYRVAARYSYGRCIPRNRIMLNCDRFRWCATCRTNLPERDYQACKRLLPGAPRHH